MMGGWAGQDPGTWELLHASGAALEMLLWTLYFLLSSGGGPGNVAGDSLLRGFVAEGAGTQHRSWDVQRAW